MKKVNLYLALIVSISNVRQTDTSLPIPIIGNVIEVLEFGMDVYSFFDSILGEDEVQNTPAPIDYKRIINRISEKINASTGAIVFRIEIQAYISELREVAMTVEQLLGEMKAIVTANSKEKREEYQRRFHNNYLQSETNIDRIKNLLTFRVDVSGFSSTLLSLIAKEYECGMTKLEEFQKYYMTLVSDVVAMALLNERLEQKSLYNETLAYWNNEILALLGEIEKQKSTCVSKFFELVNKDFHKISDPSQLYKSNHRRYPYKSTDILFLSGSYCVWNQKKYKHILKKKQDKTTTFMVIKTEDIVSTHTNEQYLKIASETKFNDCLNDVVKIWRFFDVLEEDLLFWLTFPQDRATKFKILLDDNSTASKIHYAVDGIKYTTLFYVRAQDNDVNSNITSADFNTTFNEDYEHTKEDSYIMGLKLWQFWSIIGGSVLALIIIIILIVRCCCCCCKKNEYRE